MIGQTIRKLRLKKGMTQKSLADKLFVSAQAVSRWENDEVEPSISTVLELAKIFEVTADEILNPDGKPQDSSQTQKTEEPAQETEAPPPPPPKQMLALCETCNSPIYDSNEIVRKDGKIFCKSCHQKKLKRERALALELARKRRIRSFIFGLLAFGLLLACAISEWDALLPDERAISIFTSISLFTFISCCILRNNFVGDLFLSIATWSIRAPGLIFTFDLDGCLWFLGMKLLFAVIGLLIGIVAFFLALIIGCVVSVFVYPYAIVKNIKNPEDTY